MVVPKVYALARKLLVAFLALVLVACTEKEADVYLFSFFQGNGEDGLHLAYSEDGMHWEALGNNRSFLTPSVGGDKLMRDPCIIKGPDGKFHMVWTVSWNERGIGYSNSEDLIHWSEQQYIPVMHHEADARNAWAPELFYDEAISNYIILWASTIPGRYPETDSLGDNGYNHRMYATITSDFQEFSPTTVLFDQGFNVIDATLLQHEGSYWMFLKDETLLPNAEKNIKIAKSDQVLGPWSKATEPISHNWVEGPTICKVNDAWIIYFDQYTQGKMGAIRSTDLTDWTDISDSIQFPEGTRHGTVLKVNKGIVEAIQQQFPKQP